MSGNRQTSVSDPVTAYLPRGTLWDAEHFREAAALAGKTQSSFVLYLWQFYERVIPLHPELATQRTAKTNGSHQ